MAIRLSHSKYAIMVNVSSYQEDLKMLQAKAEADLQKLLADAAKQTDPLRVEQTMFLMSLIRARLKKGLSQSELATKLGTQQSVISRIESGHGNPGFRTLLAIAKAIDVDLVLEYK